MYCFFDLNGGEVFEGNRRLWGADGAGCLGILVGLMDRGSNYLLWKFRGDRTNGGGICIRLFVAGKERGGGAGSGTCSFWTFCRLFSPSDPS